MVQSELLLRVLCFNFIVGRLCTPSPSSLGFTCRERQYAPSAPELIAACAHQDSFFIDPPTSCAEGIKAHKFTRDPNTPREQDPSVD